MSSSKPSSDKPLVPPFRQFHESSLIFLDEDVKLPYATSLLKLNDLATATLKDPISIEFLSVQAEMLISKKDGDEGFHGFIIQAKKTKNSLGLYDTSDCKIHMPIQKPIRDAPFADTLSHEMTHAIDHIYQCKSEDKVLGVLSSVEDKEEQKNIIELVSKTFADAMQRPFKELYINPAFKAELSFVEALEPYHATDSKAVINQRSDARSLAVEFSSFSFESLFCEINDPIKDRTNFFARYEALYKPDASVAVDSSEVASIRSTRRRKVIPKEAIPPEQGAIAQEISAVAIHDINKHMISHIESVHEADRSAERNALLVELKSVDRFIAPAYERAVVKIARHEDVLAKTAGYVTEGGAVGSALDSPRERRVAVFDTSDIDNSRRVIAEEGRKLLKKAFTDRMRVSLSERRDISPERKAELAKAGKEMFKEFYGLVKPKSR